MATPFKALLCLLSSKLNNQEVKQMVLLSSVPESVRSDINDGLSLFENLIQRDIINKNNLKNLKAIFDQVHPKRRDLINEIVYFEENGTLNKEDSLKAIRFCAQQLQTIESNQPKTENVSTTNGCIIQSPCCTCQIVSCSACNIPAIYVILTIVIFISVLFVILLWYADVPKASHSIKSNDAAKKAGPFIITLMIVTYIAALCILYLKRRSNLSNNSGAEPSSRDNLDHEERVVGSRRSSSTTPVISSTLINNVSYSNNVDYDSDIDNNL
ncbi:uncharacterized protein LOC124458193 [Xenia sp. Carnegie-2017]|uniref:uncharacterized protein LOC124458193 n=1 Tax=Xenia sp. Carnegie-2017 TaxID=2897299 RepID=UPI001F04E456|nr:uncharacterized protein LOC124458193 [Xenia sp. Carnegie-2017]